MPILRILLLPFSCLYALATDLRNRMFDWGIKKTTAFDPFIISVGNITAGGTGKTPFVELLIRLLKDRYTVAVLSRGYRRQTKGFVLADATANAKSIGDEPFQYYSKFGREIAVAVGEKRALAIPRLIAKINKLEVIILDDAFQHRSVARDLDILLSDYHRPFYKDAVLPAGLLRESRRHAKRADVVVVTKCPHELALKEKESIIQQIGKYGGREKPVFFTGVTYLKPQKLYGNQQFSKNVVLFSGIANADQFENYVDKHFNLVTHKRYPDHYSFTQDDIRELIAIFDEVTFDEKCLLTTEKDMVRLLGMKEGDGLDTYPVFYLPIELYFTENGDFFANYLNSRMEEEINRQAH
ncbi:MAG: tetraacyldisaccharide 4'-kinase [Cyclobacteriaceae bacterium]|nr:tetraacyldisaccharide 4'-kinase [Cyclobacteriaceae bacterium]